MDILSHQHAPKPISTHAPTRGATEITLGTADLPQISIHAPTRGATAILAKKPFPFLAEINKLSFYILNFPLFHPLFFPHSTSFVHILRCESPDVFMYASYSHSCMITKSKYRLLQFLGRRPYVPPLSDTYFPDNRTSGCQRSHQ